MTQQGGREGMGFFWNRGKDKVNHLTEEEICAVRTNTIRWEEFKVLAPHLKRCKSCDKRLFSRMSVEQALILSENIDRLIKEDAQELKESLQALLNNHP